jgi:hypothetical protein
MNLQRGDVLKARFPPCLEKIGRLSAEMLVQLDNCLKAALGIA